MIRLFGFVLVRAKDYDAMQKRIVLADRRAASRRRTETAMAARPQEQKS